MTRVPLFITGTGTGVGKTTLAALITLHLRRRGIRALAIKPYCSGSRHDTELLAAVNDHELSVEVVTPVFCHEPLAPLAALDAEASALGFKKAVEAIETISKDAEILLVEGIGGLEVPLATGFAVSNLITETNSRAVVVGQNRLGMINEVALTQYRLREVTGSIGQLVLMGVGTPDASASRNVELVSSMFVDCEPVELPYLGPDADQIGCLRVMEKKLEKPLAQILESIIVSSS
ncbi:MAG: ATP-dependent dethiobiotin synthetase BioD [Verrucomicrobia subdivision 3 bacterium]|nr:ATP-dependent dethiobiotin synthetase BioD [Limisphaerales bacterium]MCS1415133.1 ATP-dependent dethiobiotin synthetase BioD [Limisphaerales bacterium]